MATETEAEAASALAPPMAPARVLVATFAFNEGPKICATVERTMACTTHDMLVMDDGFTDDSIEPLRQPRVHIISTGANGGIGAAMKAAFNYAIQERYDVVVIMAGNNKDDPAEIPRLLAPILAGSSDFVQGSRHMHGRAEVHADLSPSCDAAAPDADVHRGRKMADGEHQRISRISTKPASRSARGLAAGLAGPLRTGALPVVQGYPS